MGTERPLLQTEAGAHVIVSQHAVLTDGTATEIIGIVVLHQSPLPFLHSFLSSPACMDARKASFSVCRGPSIFSPRVHFKEGDHGCAAWSYPLRLLSRAFNPFTPEILAFRNQEPSRIILLYDHGDDLAASAANLMFEKGIDNVFVLNGGTAVVCWR